MDMATAAAIRTTAIDTAVAIQVMATLTRRAMATLTPRAMPTAGGEVAGIAGGRPSSLLSLSGLLILHVERRTKLRPSLWTAAFLEAPSLLGRAQGRRLRTGKRCLSTAASAPGQAGQGRRLFIGNLPLRCQRCGNTTPIIGVKHRNRTKGMPFSAS